MEGFFAGAGVVVVAVFTFCLFAYAVGYVIGAIAGLRNSELKKDILSMLQNTNRYCAYDFPQMEFLLDALIDAIDKDYRVDPSALRTEARARFDIKETK